MDMEFSPEDLAFQREVREFIAEHYPDELRGKQDEGEELSKEDFLAWHKVLYKKGWVAPAWPVEYGGTGWTPTQRFIFSEETARADCIRLMPFGLAMVGAGDLHFRYARTESLFPAAHPVGRGLVVPGLFGAGLGL